MGVPPREDVERPAWDGTATPLQVIILMMIMMIITIAYYDDCDDYHDHVLNVQPDNFQEKKLSLSYCVAGFVKSNLILSNLIIFILSYRI